MPLPRFRPMLAENRPARLPAADWVFEPKVDGWRCLLTVDDSSLTLRTRTGRDITVQAPELAGLPEAIGRNCILDGELVTGGGTPHDFYELAPRLAVRPRFAEHARPLTFVAFDVLWIDDGPVIRQPYRVRRRILGELALAGPAWTTVPAFADEPSRVMAAVETFGLEGMVAKRVDAPYRPGERSDCWLKLKTAEWREVHAPLRHEKG